MPLLTDRGPRGHSKEYDMISKDEKLFIIDGFLKSLRCQEIMLNDRITTDLNQEEVAEINFSIASKQQEIQAIESEKININQGE